jgi:hypothetical protein
MTQWSLQQLDDDLNPVGSSINIDVSRATIDFNADIQEIRRPKKRGMIISIGRKTDKLRLEGSLVKGSNTMQQLEDNYILPIRDMVYHKVTVSEGTSQQMYENQEEPSGEATSHENWVMTKALFREKGGYTQSYEFEIEFMAGSYHKVLE